MKFKLAAFTLAAVVFSPSLFAQTPQGQGAAQPSACLPTTTLDQLIKALDDAVSGPADKDRTCFRDVILPDARLMPLVHAADGSVAPRILTVDDWINAVRKRGSSVFYERQVKVITETYGHMAHLWSTYETRTTPDGKPEVRGINSIQAVNDGQRWRVISIEWQAETPAEQVPAQYLP
jgi:hypothetical protein